LEFGIALLVANHLQTGSFVEPGLMFGLPTNRTLLTARACLITDRPSARKRVHWPEVDNRER